MRVLFLERLPSKAGPWLSSGKLHFGNVFNISYLKGVAHDTCLYNQCDWIWTLGFLPRVWNFICAVRMHRCSIPMKTLCNDSTAEVVQQFDGGGIHNLCDFPGKAPLHACAWLPQVFVLCTSPPYWFCLVTFWCNKS